MSIYPPVRGELARLLSAPRLDAYKAAAGGRLDDALQLYAWNLSISTALFESIHYLEVAVRNTMDSSLTTWSAATSGSVDPWYRNSAVALSAPSRSKVRLAVDRATDHSTRPELPGRVVAELSLGFWWSLLADSYSRTLWQPCLRRAFPQARRSRLHDSLGGVLRLRNRIAHHEPVHQRDLSGDYTTILATAERITPRLAWWIDVTSRVPTVLRERP